VHHVTADTKFKIENQSMWLITATYWPESKAVPRKRMGQLIILLSDSMTSHTV